VTGLPPVVSPAWKTVLLQAKLGLCLDTSTSALGTGAG
jgi:hypothetical protein